MPIAIVGIGLRMPGGIDDPNSLWRLLIDGRDAISDVPDDRWNLSRFYHPDPSASGRLVSRKGGFVRRMKDFDAAFWGISPREAVRMDPQQRWLLETAWEAIEDAGVRPLDLRGRGVGVYVGASSHDYGTSQLEDLQQLDVHSNTGGANSILANRLSYLLDLRGPSLVVDTACSSALVAIAMAVESIRSGVCQSALAGGVNSLIVPNSGIGFSKAGMLSPTGQCFAFDARANGYVRSEGAGLLLLKPLASAIADGDSIYAVIRGAAVNSDGHTSSLTVPSADGQATMLRQAYADAGVNPADVCYVEAHGTGTPVGDPIEAAALGEVFSNTRPDERPLWIGSIKTNLGHLESASGIAGMIKAALVLQRRTIPANANFTSINENIDANGQRLRVVEQSVPLGGVEGKRPIVGVNSFGFGGTNAHIVLEAAPDPVDFGRSVIPQPLAERPYVLPLSARDAESLRLTAKAYRRALSTLSESLPEFCFSAGARRQNHPHRLVVNGNDADQLIAGLNDWLADRSGASTEPDDSDRWVHGEANSANGESGEPYDAAQRGLTMVFTGQGSQWTGMGRTLKDREPIVRETLVEIDEIFASHSGWSLVEAMQDDNPDRVDRTIVAQPAIFAIQVALVRLWRSWGVEPEGVIGHSVGEVAAAWTAGVFSLADAVELVYHRSRLQDRTGGQGKMAAVGMTPQQVEPLLAEYSGQVAITAVNSPSLITIGGDRQVMESIVAELESREIFVRWLKLDYAFHTHQMDPIEDELKDALADLRPTAGKIHFISTVTGERIDTSQLGADYWWRNVREPVQFESAIETAIAQNTGTFLEVGPHPSMRSSIESIVQDPSSILTLHSLSRHQDASTSMTVNLARLHIHGRATRQKNCELNWQAINQAAGQFVRQPAYAWNRRTFWLNTFNEASRLSSPDHPLLQMRLRVAQPTWQTVLDPAVLTYLKDHQIWDGIVFPAAAYVEIGLAVAQAMDPDQRYCVEDVQLHAALFVSADAATQLQVACNPDAQTIQIHSSNDSVNWILNGQCRLVPDKGWSTPEKRSVESEPSGVSDESVFIDHETLYEQLRRAGYQFGETFSLIEKHCSTKNESIARINIPVSLRRNPSDADSEQTVFHPAVLDACFQASLRISASSPEDASLYLPTTIGQVRLYQDTDAEMLTAVAHNFFSESDQRRCDIDVFNVDGDRVAEIRRFCVTRAGTKAAASTTSTSGSAEPIHDSFYRVDWKQQRLPGTRVDGCCQFPASKVLLAELDALRQSTIEKYELDRYFETASPQLNEITVASIQNAYVHLGWGSRFGWSVGEKFTTGELLATDVFNEEYHELVASQLRWLERFGWLKLELDESLATSCESRWKVLRDFRRIDVTRALQAIETERPELGEDVALAKALLPCMAGILAGDVNALQRTFPNGSSHLMENFYTRNPDCASYRELLAATVRRLVQNLPTRRTLRILEVGAGTGAMTAAVIELLGEAAMPVSLDFEYHFTDVSPSFVSAARSRFASQPKMTFGVVDVERAPMEQDIEAGSFDLVIAANVLHATRDLQQSLEHLRACLSDDGILLLQEITGRLPMIENTFGLLPGWWRFADRQLRAGCPLIDRDQWGQLLGETGWNDVSTITTDTEHGVSSMALIIAHRAQKPTAAVGTQGEIPAHRNESFPRLLIFVDRDGALFGLAERYIASGGEVTLLTHDDDWQKSLASMDWQSDRDWLIVHGWSLDVASPPASDLDLLRSFEEGVHCGLQLAQLVDAADLNDRVRICFVTRDAQRVSDADRVDGYAASSLSGFAGVLKNELPSLGVTMIDLCSDSLPDDENWIDDLLAELTTNVNERDVAYRDGRRYVSRMQRTVVSKFNSRRKALTADSSRYRLEMRKAGRLEDLSWNETRTRELSENELELRVEAGGINFRDVMKALGIYPGNPPDRMWFGDDVAGVVERVGALVTDFRVGDRVVGVAPWAFRSHAVTDHRLVMPCPDCMPMTAAATLPTVFLTAQFAIDQVARMRSGESILIHAAAGGVGQAAIQVAQSMNLEVFATAGSPAKRDLLRSLGVQHVMDSRSFEFADQVMDLTCNRGVDGVLNSLAGEFITKSLSVIAPFGRFLEIGKADVYGNHALGLGALKNNVSYHVIDLSQWIVERPDSVAGLLNHLRSRFETGSYRPLTHQVYPASEVVTAFRTMAKGEHVGKNVLDFSAMPVDHPIIGPCTEPASRFNSTGTFLITGGCGGFGWEVAKWLTTRGARSLVLMSRGGPDTSVAAEIEALRDSGVDIVEARGDVTIREDVDRVIRAIGQSDRPLVGVLHAAMVIDDDFITHLDIERFDRVLLPKALGAWHLHHATQELPLDHFILFASISSMMGAPRQSHYNAGNEFLNGLARHRRALKMNALSINWSAIEGAGFVHRNPATAEYLRSTGFATLLLEQALAVLDELTLTETDVVGVAEIDWQRIGQLGVYPLRCPYFEKIRDDQPLHRGSGSLRKLLHSAPPQQRPILLRQFLVEQVAGVFGIGSGEIDPELSLTRLGLDSLMAVELVNRIETELTTNLPMSRLLTGPSINSLVNLLLPSIFSEGEANVESTTVDPQPEFLDDARWDDQLSVPSQRADVHLRSNRLLTGATGFLGAHLLSDLLTHTEGRVTCLVRATDAETAREKIEINLQRYGVAHPESLDRVDVIVGDLTLQRFGLSEQAFDQLAANVGVIVHNAADVNLVQSYEMLRDVNVGGTREVLRLACQAKLKPIHFVSTYTVYATLQNRGMVIDEDQPLPACEELLYGYSQTKWVGEMLMCEARRRGVPVTIYRPGHITGDSSSGIGNENDLLHTMILTCLKVGSAPLSDVELDATPVDYVSRGIVHLSLQDNAEDATYHVANPVPLRTQVLREWLEETDVAVELVPPQRWREQLLEFGESSASENHLVQLLAGMLKVQVSAEEDDEVGFLPRLSCHSTTKQLLDAGIACPPVDRRLMEVGARYLQRIGLIDPIETGRLSCS